MITDEVIVNGSLFYQMTPDRCFNSLLIRHDDIQCSRQKRNIHMIGIHG